MNRRIFFTVLGIGILMAGFVSPTNAQMSIVGVSPVEGTVGTEVTMYGAGFGAKQGEVLIGEEKCKVQEWSDSQITCEVHKPQAPGEYTLTVLRQGDKKPAEPLTFSYFAMRQPNLFQGELAQEGATVTVLGEFFGDKKGEIRIGYLEGGLDGEVMITSPKIVDWSMEAIRFEIPAGLVGKFVLKVSNEVGASYALLDLGGGTPLLGEFPSGWPAGQGWESNDAADGVWFKGNFYVFHLLPSYVGASEVRCRIFDPTTGSLNFCPGTTMPKIYTWVTPEAVVVKDAAGVDKELWLFHVTGSREILFSRFNGSEWLCIPWAGGCSQTPPVVDWYVSDSKSFQPAAVFNPVTLQVTLYVTYQTHINFAQTSNGVNWVHSGAVWPYSASGLSAVYHQGSVNGTPYDTLLAFQDNLCQKFVYYLKEQGHGGVVAQYILNDPYCKLQEPDLVNLDNDPAGGVAMIYPNASENFHHRAEMRTLGTNGAWSGSTTIFTFPDPGELGQYYWKYDYYGEPVNNTSAALIYWPDGTRRIMFLYLYHGCDDFDPNYFKMIALPPLN